MIVVFKKVFSNVRYLLLAGVTALAVFSFLSWLQNFKLIFAIFSSPAASLSDKVDILVGLLISTHMSFGILSIFSYAVIAALFGINFSMMAYYFQKQKASLRQGGTAISFAGLGAGTVGAGCAACGTLVLAPFLSFIGASGLIAFLPFGGAEFGILGIGILILSIFLIAKNMRNSNICSL